MLDWLLKLIHVFITLVVYSLAVFLNLCGASLVFIGWYFSKFED